jgi:hypothetical protein
MSAGLNSERDVNPSQPTTEKTLADFDPVKKPKGNKFAFACAILASMASILLGYGEDSIFSQTILFITWNTASEDSKKLALLTLNEE